MNYDKKIELLDGTLNASCFIKKRQFTACGKAVTIYYSDGMVDQVMLDQFVVEPLQRNDVEMTVNGIESLLSHIEVTAQHDMDTVIKSVFDANTLLVIEDMDEYFMVSCKMYASRAIAEPPTSAVLKGPREGFTEDFQANVTMIRRKLKTKDLKFDVMKIGKQTSTTVSVVYMENIADKSIVDNIKERLQSIDIDGVLDSSYVRSYLAEHKISIFRQVGDTEKPDILASKLLEGRVGIIVDGSPIVLTLPFLAIEDFQSADDYYTVPYFASFVRILRFVAMCLGVFVPGLYVAYQIFHMQFLPLKFLTTISSSVKDIPLTANIEMLFVLFLFELLNEASIRMPRYVGMALSVVGALVLGDTAVRAGIVSTPTILIMALSGIAVYTVPDDRNTLSILRLVFLLIAGSMGVIGVIAGIGVVALYLVTLSNYNVPYLSPYAPRIDNDLKDGFIKSPLPVMNERPKSLNNKNKTRLIWKS